MEDIRAISVVALGAIAQWALFGPKKFPTWAAWAIISGVGAALYFWFTPTAITDFGSNWRTALYGLVLFVMSAKGVGSTLKAGGLAPGSNTL